MHLCNRKIRARGQSFYRSPRNIDHFQVDGEESAEDSWNDDSDDDDEIFVSGNVKLLKNSDTQKIAEIILKFKQTECSFTIQHVFKAAYDMANNVNPELIWINTVA